MKRNILRAYKKTEIISKMRNCKLIEIESIP